VAVAAADRSGRPVISGMADSIIMRIMDSLMAIPAILLAIALVGP